MCLIPGKSTGMKSTLNEGTKMSHEMEEICAGRRLVLECPVSVCMKVVAVVLDSAAEAMDDEVECAAMLVPKGKEFDWMYSSEGGQWQLVASAGVSRLILLSRVPDASGEDAVSETTTNFARVEKGQRPLTRLKSAGTFFGGPGHVEREHTADWGQRRDEATRSFERDASQGIRDCGKRIGKSNLDVAMIDLNEARENRSPQDRHHPSSREKTSELHNERRCRRSRRMNERHQRGGSTDEGKQFSVSLEDDALKHVLHSLVLALSPKKCFKTGMPNVPFVNYTDNVLQRVVVEEAFSTVTGLMRVEDVELEIENKDMEERLYSRKEASRSGLPEDEGIIKVERSMRSWRRRLIFRRMPNLIQTEVLLTVQSRCGKRRISHQDKGWCKERRKRISRIHRRQAESEVFSLEATVRRVDSSRLVHKYLPPIVAGFVLVASCLDRCLMSHSGRARVLLIGVGGGALPIFLRKHFWFNLQVVDVDEVVLHLARRHFGLEEDEFLQVTVGDGLAVVEEIAARALEESILDDSFDKSWRRSSDLWPAQPSSSRHRQLPDSALAELLSSAPQKSASGCWLREFKGGNGSELRKENVDVRSDKLRGGLEVSASSSMQQCEKHPQMEVIIVDVDASDAWLGLSSPTVPFLEQKFLLSARIVLEEGGMLVMNVVPCGDKPYENVINSLKAVFAEVYEISLKDDLNHVVFSLPTPLSYNHQLRTGHTVEQVKKVVGGRLIRHIRRM